MKPRSKEDFHCLKGTIHVSGTPKASIGSLIWWYSLTDLFDTENAGQIARGCNRDSKFTLCKKNGEWSEIRKALTLLRK